MNTPELSPEAEESPHPRYRVLSEKEWADVRTAYLSGTPAFELCRHYGMSRSTLHARAARDSWRRSDQPAVERSPFLTVVGFEEPTYFDLKEMALLRLRQAITHGRPREAGGWLKLMRDLRVESLEWDWNPEDDLPLPEPDSSDSLDSNSESSSPVSP